MTLTTAIDSDPDLYDDRGDDHDRNYETNCRFCFCRCTSLDTNRILYYGINVSAQHCWTLFELGRNVLTRVERVNSVCRVVIEHRYLVLV